MRTMIFDEVDAGVGGETAQTVGRALGRTGALGRAAGARRHSPPTGRRVLRRSSPGAEGGGRRPDDRGRSFVWSETDRIEELSRMLAGLPDSEVAQEHARELLELADGAPVA